MGITQTIWDSSMAPPSLVCMGLDRHSWLTDSFIQIFFFNSKNPLPGPVKDSKDTIMTVTISALKVFCQESRWYLNPCCVWEGFQKDIHKMWSWDSDRLPPSVWAEEYIKGPTYWRRDTGQGRKSVQMGIFIKKWCLQGPKMILMAY